MSRAIRSRARVRYSLDDGNRLIISEEEGTADRLRSMRRVEGRLTTEGRNRLVYLVDAPSDRDAAAEAHRQPSPGGDDHVLTRLRVLDHVDGGGASR